jgi:hypothetical protein
MGIQMGVTTGTILQGVNGSSLEGPLLRVTQAGPLFSSVAPVKSGTPLPTMVTTLSSAAPQRKNGYRVPIIIRKGGADEPKEPFQDEHVDWIVNMSIPASGNKYRIQASSHDGLTGPAYTASSEGEARRKAEELQQWLEVMGVLRNYQNPLHPMGLQLKTEQGLAPSYLIGKEFNVSVFTEKTGYLLLLGLEQNGKMDVFYPNQKSGEFRLEPGRSVNLPLAAAEPAGETTVVAFISTHPLSPPEDLLEPGGGGGIHWIVMPEKRTEFLRWLSEALHRTVADAPAATRDLITPASGAALATSFDVQTLVVRVREPEREQ